MSKLKPVLNRIVLKLTSKYVKDPSGIIIPTQGEDCLRGEVIACGPGYIDNNGNRVPCQVETGDHVILLKTAGLHIDEWYIATDIDVMAVEELTEEELKSRKHEEAGDFDKFVKSKQISKPAGKILPGPGSQFHK